MRKNWLIRTKTNHILGPVSLEKIRDLLEKSALDEDDEICSGNGYWISIKEKELIEKYIIQGDKQSFNPVSEAPEDEKETSLGPAFSEAIPPSEIEPQHLTELKNAKSWNSFILYFFLLLSLAVGFLAFYYRKVIIMNLVN